MSPLTHLVLRARPLQSIVSATPRTLPRPTSRTFSLASLFSSDAPSHSKSASKSSSSTTSATLSPASTPNSAPTTPAKPVTESGSVATSRTSTSPSPFPSSTTTKPHPKTPAELDEELRAKMSEMAGDGGASGVEYEDGVPVSMKRSVKNNMFRYI